MIQSNKKFNGYQLVVFLIYSILGVSLLQLPSTLTEKVGNEAYLIPIISGLISLISLFLICTAVSVYNGKGLVSTSQSIYGKILGTLIVIPFIINMFIANSVEAKIFSVTIKKFLLEYTPTSAILIPFFLLIMFLARGEIRHIGRFAEFTVPFVILIILLLSILTIPGAKFSNLLPVLQRSPSEYLEAIQGSMFSYLGIGSILVILPYFQNKEMPKLFKVSSIAIVVITVMYTLITMLCIAKLGTSETRWIIYPTISLIKSAYIPGGFIERLEGLLMSIWVVLTFMTMVISIYAIVEVIGDIFNLKSKKHIVTILIPFIYISATSTVDILEVISILKISNLTLGIYTLFVLPILIYLGYKVRFKRGKDYED